MTFAPEVFERFGGMALAARTGGLVTKASSKFCIAATLDAMFDHLACARECNVGARGDVPAPAFDFRAF
jgi:hypothetical protein